MSLWKALVFFLVATWSFCVSDGARKNYVGVVGGAPVPIEDFPFMASLRVFGSHKCGATIIHEQYILTAAHCLDFNFPLFMSVVVGATNVDEDGDEYRVDGAIKHPEYMEGRDYDLGIVKLRDALRFSEKVKVAKLCNVDQDYHDGTVFNITGWGTIQYRGAPSNTLLRSEVPWVDQNTCQKEYAHLFQVNDHMVCAGREGHDACQGDSGGPLSLNGEVVGVVSGGWECALKDYATVYVKVSQFIGWIERMIKE